MKKITSPFPLYLSFLDFDKREFLFLLFKYYFNLFSTQLNIILILLKAKYKKKKKIIANVSVASMLELFSQ